MNKMFIENVWCFGPKEDLFKQSRKANLDDFFSDLGSTLDIPDKYSIIDNEKRKRITNEWFFKRYNKRNW